MERGGGAGTRIAGAAQIAEATFETGEATMNTNDPWKRLGAAASHRPRAADEPAEMPFGFDTRVLARLRASRAWLAEVWLRLALRALPVGATVLIVCWLATQLPTRQTPPPADVMALAELTVKELLP